VPFPPPLELLDDTTIIAPSGNVSVVTVAPSARCIVVNDAPAVLFELLLLLLLLLPVEFEPDPAPFGDGLELHATASETPMAAAVANRKKRRVQVTGDADGRFLKEREPIGAIERTSRKAVRRPPLCHVDSTCGLK
jgi:hypothetical protein